MGLSFLSPVGFFLVLAVALPLLGLALFEQRAARIRHLLGLRTPAPRRRIELSVAFLALATLLALASAQPVLAITHSRPARSDAEMLVVFDTSRSMQASLARGRPTRLERSKSFAVKLRSLLGDVPVGAAGMTDRVLPYLFPTPNAEVFDDTVAQSIAIERPPPQGDYALSGNAHTRATTLAALAAVATRNYFTPGVTHRLLVVLSDDESNPFVESNIGVVFRKRPRVHTIFVRFWNARERIWLPNGHVDDGYRPDPTGARTEETLAVSTHGRAFTEGQLQAVVAAAHAALGTGSLESRPIDRARTPIAGWVALVALVPLGFVLRRRNF
jgi:hypothetical protein